MPLPSSLPNRKTNAGFPLTSEFLGGESDTIREIPPEFRAALDLTVIEIPLPWDVPPVPLSDTVLASKAEQKVTSERIRRTTYKPPGQVPLVEYYTNREKQLVTRTRTFKTQGDAILSPSATLDVKTQNLGNYHFIEDDDLVSFIFTGLSTTKEIADPIPEKFRIGFPAFERRQILTGTVADPQILGANEFLRTETQKDVFLMERTTKYRDYSLGLPSQMLGYKLTPELQVMTTFETLNSGLQTLAPNYLWKEGEVVNLGNGMSIQRVGTVPSLFARHKYDWQIPDTIPVEFRPFIPTITTETTAAGSATPPSPVPNGLTLFASDQDETVFTHRTTQRTRNPLSLPILLTGYELTEQFGGATLQNTRRLDNHGAMVVDTGLTVLSSAIKDLGNGLDVKETRSLYGVAAWPTLYATVFDDVMKNWRTEEEQVVSSSYTPTYGPFWVESLKPIDQWRAKRTKITRIPVATSQSTALVSVVYQPYTFPGLLDMTYSTFFDRQSKASVCEHVILTWWLQQHAVPTIGPTGSGAQVIIENIITNDVISNNLAGTAAVYHRGVLNDAFTFNLIPMPASTPTWTDYKTNWVGTWRSIGGSVTPEPGLPDVWRCQVKQVLMR